MVNECYTLMSFFRFIHILSKWKYFFLFILWLYLKFKGSNSIINMSNFKYEWYWLWWFKCIQELKCWNTNKSAFQRRNNIIHTKFIHAKQIESKQWFYLNDFSVKLFDLCLYKRALVCPPTDSHKFQHFFLHLFLSIRTIELSTSIYLRKFLRQNSKKESKTITTTVKCPMNTKITWKWNRKTLHLPFICLFNSFNSYLHQLISISDLLPIYFSFKWI